MRLTNLTVEVGLAGGVLATAVMGLFYFQFAYVFSLIGVSIVGAFVYNLIQLVLAALWVVGSTQVFYLLPIMLLSSLFSGFLVGLFAHYVVQKVRQALVRGYDTPSIARHPQISAWRRRFTAL